MAKVVVVKKSSDAKKAITAEHKRVRSERIARQMARSAITFPRRGRAGRRAK
jgi:hypothetical protein